MRIVHVITSINRGGAENHLLYLALAQRSQGFKVFVFYLKGDGYWRLKLESQGVKVFNLHLKFYGDIVPIFMLKALFSNIKPDIVHAHMPPAELYCRFAMLFAKSKSAFVISKHNDEPFFKGLGNVALGSWVSSRSQKVIAISDSVNSYMSSNLRIQKDKLVTVRYGLDCSE